MEGEGEKCAGSCREISCTKRGGLCGVDRPRQIAVARLMYLVGTLEAPARSSAGALVFGWAANATKRLHPRVAATPRDS